MTAQDIDDVVEVDDYYDKAKIRPLQGGCYTEHLELSGMVYGTLGCAVTYTGPDGGPHGDNEYLRHGDTYALSAAHVIGGIGTTVGQPTNTDNDVLGAVQLAVLLEDDPYGDFAICDLFRYPDKFQPEIISLGAVLGEYDVTDEDHGELTVSKRGSQTGTTRGRVENTNVTARFTHGGREYELKGLIQIGALKGQFADHGDSGSVVVGPLNQVIGLLVGASLDFTQGYAVPIARIRERLQVKVRTANLWFHGGPVLRVPKGQDEVTLFLRLSAPAPTIGVDFDLTTDKSTSAKVPPQTTIPSQGLRSVPIKVTRIPGATGVTRINAVAEHIPNLKTQLVLQFE
ncbi:hypothetical protein E1263_16080 [Kribbella antibiotica]|uniref:Serine protease n=1 Tax=Kribbella antibiotica TaxID=190195 RepID=A0A4R4ZLS3_9ACTN|nr:hypothetical protein [Kribbella antibiotica]TDD59170.1 hypothetical protein E1263_16080 [Kribbella antibiotica]